MKFRTTASCEPFLYRIFVEGDRPVVRQRFGGFQPSDLSSIGCLRRGHGLFPGSSKADLPNSFRFGQGVADIATPLGIRPQTLVGLGPTTSRINRPSTQIRCFSSMTPPVLGVLPAYAEYLIDAFSPNRFPMATSRLSLVFTRLTGTIIYRVLWDTMRPTTLLKLLAGSRNPYQ